MTLAWRHAVASDRGLLRDINEDSAFAGTRLVAVADGMGGHAAGEVASAAAIAAIAQLDELGIDAGDPAEALRDAVLEANTNLRLMVGGDSDLQGMGTTLTALVADGDHLVLAHIGDSRAYRLRNGELTQLTTDHTLVQQLVEQGRLAPEDVHTHPQRSLITRAVDGREGVEPDMEVLEVEAGDRYLLCTDGLSGVVSDETLGAVLGDGDLEAVAERLVDLTLRAGAPDNVTCVVADVVEEAAVAGAPASRAGAANGETTRGSAGDGDIPAVAAAASGSQAPLREPRVTPAAVAGADAADRADPRERNRSLRRRRTAVITVVVLALLAAGALLGWRWVQQQYYVGEAAGQVAIFRGVEGSVAGLDLSSEKERSEVAVADLLPFQQEQVRDGISAEDLDDARRILARLTPAPTATPSVPTASPRPTTTPSPAETPDASPS